MKKKKSTTKEDFKVKKIKIKIIGIGGGAISIIRDISPSLPGVNFLAIDTDKRSFSRLGTRIKHIQFGEELTKGWGTGMNTSLAEDAIKQVKPKIIKEIEKTDLVITISSLGGGVGSGATPEIAKMIEELKKTSLGIFTLPFSFEGDKKMKIAKSAVLKTKDNFSGFITLPNEEILKLSDKKASLKQSLSLVNDVLVDYLGDLINIIYNPGIINIDFADIKNILKSRGHALCFGRGVGSGSERVSDALKKIFDNPFFGERENIKKILFNIASGEDLHVKEIEEIADQIFTLNPKAKIIFGISRDPKLKKKIKITFLGSRDEANKEEKRGRPKKKKEEPKPKPKSKPKNKKVRKSAVEVKKEIEQKNEEEWDDNTDYEIPTFLRDN